MFDYLFPLVVAAAVVAIPSVFIAMLFVWDLRRKSYTPQKATPTPTVFAELLPAYSERPHYQPEPVDAIVEEESDRQRIERIRRKISAPTTLTPSQKSAPVKVIRSVEDRKRVDQDHNLEITNQ